MTTEAPTSIPSIFDDAEMQQTALAHYNKIIASLYKSPSTSFTQSRLSAINIFKSEYDSSWLNLLAKAFKSLYGHWVKNESPESAIYLIIKRLNDSWDNSRCVGVCYGY